MPTQVAPGPGVVVGFGDATGDGRADAIIGGRTVRRSTGSGLGTPEDWGAGTVGGTRVESYYQDVTGDGVMDALHVVTTEQPRGGLAGIAYSHMIVVRRSEETRSATWRV